MYEFNHITSSPRYPQSNGFAEHTVQTVKNILKKAKQDCKDPYLALLDLRNTPIEGLDSPVQLLMGRRTRTLLPTKPSLLMPATAGQQVRRKLESSQFKQKQHYDRTAKSLTPLSQGDSVRMKTEVNTWKAAIVKKCLNEPRSYIMISNHKEYRRNRRDLRKTKEILPDISVEDNLGIDTSRFTSSGSTDNGNFKCKYFSS